MEINVTDVRQEGIRQTWTLHHLTDTHIDDPDHAHEELAARIEEIRTDPFALWAGGGDYGSLILPGDKRFGSGGHIKGDWAEHLSRLPDYYLDRCEETFGPIADKCLGLIVGNHEATVSRNYHRGVGAELAARLGNPKLYLGDRGWMVVRFKAHNKHVTLKVFAYHGWSAGRLKGRKAIQGERDLGAWDADVFLLGHDHQPASDLWWTESCEGSKKGYGLKQRPRAVINGGSWTYGQAPPTPDREKLGWKPATMPGQSWAQGKNFRPQPPASPTLELKVDMGHGVDPKNNHAGRPAGIDMEIRYRGNRFHFGEAA